jgi:hypothetical protein
MMKRGYGSVLMGVIVEQWLDVLVGVAVERESGRAVTGVGSTPVGKVINRSS